jgi:putative transposase
LPLALARGGGVSFLTGFSHNLNSMPVVNVLLHFVWATKNRTPYLATPEIRQKVWQHLSDNAKIKGIHLIAVSGHSDHCHCIVSLGKDQTISKIAQLLKGECSFWINKSGLISDFFPKEKFDWQEDYFAESVSPHLLHATKNYLLIQEEHHKKNSFQDEIEKFFKEYNAGNLPM